MQANHIVKIGVAKTGVTIDPNHGRRSGETVFVSGRFVVNEAKKDSLIGRFERLFHPIVPV